MISRRQNALISTSSFASIKDFKKNIDTGDFESSPRNIFNAASKGRYRKNAEGDNLLAHQQAWNEQGMASSPTLRYLDSQVDLLKNESNSIHNTPVAS